MQRNRALEVKKKKRNLGHTVSLLNISFQGKKKTFLLAMDFRLQGLKYRN